MVSHLPLSSVPVEFRDGDAYEVRYLRRPFQREPDFGVTSVTTTWSRLCQRSAEPN